MPLPPIANLERTLYSFVVRAINQSYFFVRMILPFVLSKRSSSDAKDEEVENGYELCGGKYATYSGFYPILRGNAYYLCAIHTNYLYLCYIYLGVGHMVSCVHAFKTKEIEIALENINLFLYIYLLCLGVSLAIFGRRNLDELFKGLGGKVYDYSRPLTRKEEDIFNDEKSNGLLFVNFFSILGGSVFYFGIWPLIKVFSGGKLSTENDSPDSYPFNKNLPLRLFVPYKTATLSSYILTFVLEFLAAVAISLTVFGYQNLFVGINVQLWNQLRLLRVSIDDLHSRALFLFASRGFKDETRQRGAFQNCLMDCLVENIKHHGEIMKLHAKVEKFYNPFLVANFLINGILVSLAVYQVYQIRTTDEGWLTKLMAMQLFTVTSIAQAAFYCLSGQRTTSLSEHLFNAFYNCNWDEYSVDFRKTLSMSIACSKKSLIFSGYNLVPANITTLVNIIKTAYTYMNFMRLAVE